MPPPREFCVGGRGVAEGGAAQDTAVEAFVAPSAAVIGRVTIQVRGKHLSLSCNAPYSPRHNKGA